MGFGSWLKRTVHKIGRGIKKAASWTWDKAKKGAHVVKRILGSKEAQRAMGSVEQAAMASGDPRAQAAGAGIGIIKGLTGGDIDHAMGAAKRGIGQKYPQYSEYIPGSRAEIQPMIQKTRKRGVDYLTKKATEYVTGSNKRQNLASARNTMKSKELWRHHPQYAERVREEGMAVPRSKPAPKKTPNYASLPYPTNI